VAYFDVVVVVVQSSRLARINTVALRGKIAAVRFALGYWPLEQP